MAEARLERLEQNRSASCGCAYREARPTEVQESTMSILRTEGIGVS